VSIEILNVSVSGMPLGRILTLILVSLSSATVQLVYLIFGLIAFILAILAIFMPEFGVWTTLYSVMFAVFAIGWGFWLGIIISPENLCLKNACHFFYTSDILA
jgi:hypothetical protein